MTTAHINPRQQDLSTSVSFADSAVANANCIPPDPLPLFVSGLLRAKLSRRRSSDTTTVGESFAQFPKQSLRGSLLRKLAGSRENAKRLLRLGAPVHSTTSSNGRSTPRSARGRPVSEIVLSQGDVQMLSSTQLEGGGMRSEVSSTTSVAGPPPVSEPSSTAPVSESTDSFPRLPNEKIVATGSGITVGIALTEPVLYLAGYDHNDPSSKKSAILRGQLHLKVTKSVKIKKISICFRGHSQTDWPDGTSFSSPGVSGAC